MRTKYNTNFILKNYFLELNPCIKLLQLFLLFNNHDFCRFHKIDRNEK